VEHQLFGAFLRLLQVTDRELFDLHLRTEQAGQATVTGVRVRADDLRGKLYGAASVPAVQQAQDAKPGSAPAPDEAGRFARLVEQYWIERLHSLGDDPEVQNTGSYAFPSREFGLFVHELTTAMHRLELMQKMEESLRRAGAYGNTSPDRRIWKQASLAAGEINAFVDWLGYNPRTRSEQERTITDAAGRPCVLFKPPPPVQDYPRIGDQPTSYDSEWYLDWLRALDRVLMDNLNFDGTRTINLEQNRALKTILDSLAL